MSDPICAIETRRSSSPGKISINRTIGFLCRVMALTCSAKMDIVSKINCLSYYILMLCIEVMNHYGNIFF